MHPHRSIALNLIRVFRDATRVQHQVLDLVTTSVSHHVQHSPCHLHNEATRWRDRCLKKSGTVPPTTKHQPGDRKSAVKPVNNKLTTENREFSMRERFCSYRDEIVSMAHGIVGKGTPRRHLRGVPFFVYPNDVRICGE